MKIQCKKCGKYRIVNPNESRECYEKRRPFCRECGNISRLKTLGGHAPNWNGGRHINSKGYVRIWIGPGSKYKFEHQLVWIKEKGSIPNGFVIHHKDGNKQNNNIDNLECLSKLDHDKKHPMIRKNADIRWGNISLEEARKEIYV